MGICSTASSKPKQHEVPKKIHKSNSKARVNPNKSQSFLGKRTRSQLNINPIIPVSSLTKKADVNKDYEFIKEVGSGAFGIIRQARKKLNQESPDLFFAVKSVWKSKFEKISLLKDEIEVLLSIEHENIIKCYEVYEDTAQVHFIMEYIEGGDLLNYIINSPDRRLDERTSLSIFFQLVNAVQYLHIEGVMHRDIKPENILIDISNISSSNEIRIKLIDFGFACFFKQNEKKMDKLGSINYTAPEVLDDSIFSTYDYKIDIWALGICLYNMLTGKQVYADDDYMILVEKIKRDPVSFSHEVFTSINYNTKELIEVMLIKDPNLRPTASDIKVNPYLNRAVGTDDKPTEFEDFKPRRHQVENIELLKKFKLMIKPIFWDFCIQSLTIEQIRSLFVEFIDRKKNDDALDVELISFEELINLIIRKLWVEQEQSQIKLFKDFLNENRQECETQKVNYKDFLSKFKDVADMLRREKIMNIFKNLSNGEEEILDDNETKEFLISKGVVFSSEAYDRYFSKEEHITFEVFLGFFDSEFIKV